jgi:hypothetical protein
MLGYGTGSKEKRTQWIVEVSKMRNIVMHPSRREHLGPEKLSKLKQYSEWLAKGPEEEGGSSTAEPIVASQPPG